MVPLQRPQPTPAEGDAELMLLLVLLADIRAGRGMLMLMLLRTKEGVMARQGRTAKGGKSRSSRATAAWHRSPKVGYSNRDLNPNTVVSCRATWSFRYVNLFRRLYLAMPSCLGLFTFRNQSPVGCRRTGWIMLHHRLPCSARQKLRAESIIGIATSTAFNANYWHMHPPVNYYFCMRINLDVSNRSDVIWLC